MVGDEVNVNVGVVVKVTVAEGVSVTVALAVEVISVEVKVAVGVFERMTSIVGVWVATGGVELESQRNANKRITTPTIIGTIYLRSTDGTTINVFSVGGMTGNSPV